MKNKSFYIDIPGNPVRKGSIIMMSSTNSHYIVLKENCKDTFLKKLFRTLGFNIIIPHGYKIKSIKIKI